MNLRRLRAVARKEFLHVLRDPRSLGMAVAIPMIMLVLFSNLVALVFREWKGCRPRTLATISIALLVLVTSVIMLTYGNYLGDKRKPAAADEGSPVAAATMQHNWESQL